MLRSIDGKSLLIGGLLVAVAVCAMGGLPLINGEHNGRFTMTGYATEFGGSVVYILDTATGQAWALNHVESKVFYAPKLEWYDPYRPADPNYIQP